MPWCSNARIRYDNSPNFSVNLGDGDMHAFKNDLGGSGTTAFGQPVKIESKLMGTALITALPGDSIPLC